MAYKLENNPLFTGETEEKTPKQGVSKKEEEKLFTPEQEEAIKAAENPNRGRPKKDEIIRTGVQAGLTEDYTRATFILSVATLEDVKNYAYTERLSMKEAVNKLLTASLDAYKANGGKLLDRNGGKA